jgi:hypothetical protein
VPRSQNPWHPVGRTSISFSSPAFFTSSTNACATFFAPDALQPVPQHTAITFFESRRLARSPSR